MQVKSRVHLVESFVQPLGYPLGSHHHVYSYSAGNNKCDPACKPEIPMLHAGYARNSPPAAAIAPPMIMTRARSGPSRTAPSMSAALPFDLPVIQHLTHPMRLLEYQDCAANTANHGSRKRSGSVLNWGAGLNFACFDVRERTTAIDLVALPKFGTEPRARGMAPGRCCRGRSGQWPPRAYSRRSCRSPRGIGHRDDLLPRPGSRVLLRGRIRTAPDRRRAGSCRRAAMRARRCKK